MTPEEQEAANTAAAAKTADAAKAAEVAAAATAAKAATIAAVAKSAAPFAFHGALGTLFNIEGEGFGKVPGTVVFGDRIVSEGNGLTGWQDTVIKGAVPHDLKPGLTTITVGDRSIKVTFQPRG